MSERRWLNPATMTCGCVFPVHYSVNLNARDYSFLPFNENSAKYPVPQFHLSLHAFQVLPLSFLQGDSQFVVTMLYHQSPDRIGHYTDIEHRQYNRGCGNLGLIFMLL